MRLQRRACKKQPYIRPGHLLGRFPDENLPFDFQRTKLSMYGLLRSLDDSAAVRPALSPPSILCLGLGTGQTPSRALLRTTLAQTALALASRFSVPNNAPSLLAEALVLPPSPNEAALRADTTVQDVIRSLRPVWPGWTVSQRNLEPGHVVGEAPRVTR